MNARDMLPVPDQNPPAPVFNFLLDRPRGDIKRLAAFADLDQLFAAMPAMFQQISSRGDMCWCLQSYLLLKTLTNLHVTLSDTLDAEAINIVHSDQLLKLEPRPNAFIVCVRADFPRRRWAHYHLVQNRNQLTAQSAWIPLWLQPRLIGRDPARRGVTNVAYAGEITNGNFGGEQEWRRAFAKEGMAFACLESTAWNDLAAIDVLIGLRKSPTGRYDGKPPSKLLNAWQAGIPFVGGHDSAYTQVGRPGEDYLRVANMQEAIEAVRALRDDPALYARLVANGRSKVGAYSQHRLAALWEHVLTGPVLERHRRWQAGKVYEQARAATLYRLGMAEHQARQIAKRIVKPLRGGGGLPQTSR